MKKKKFYAVKKGRKTEIYESWDECRKQVEGYSGAQYKGFFSLDEAKAYLYGSETKEQEESGKETDEEGVLKVYVDGSYHSRTGDFSYGMVVLQGDREELFSEKITDPQLAEMHNVAGEIKGAEAAMRYALERGVKRLVIYHDYEGIAKWCTGEWKAGKPGTQAYREVYNSVKDQVEIRFVKVTGHSNDKYNDLADQLAREALGMGRR